MKNVVANARFWIAGILAAIAGVVLARTIGPSLRGTERLYVTLAGQLLALSGLFIICFGVRRRIKQSDPEGDP